MAFFDPYTSMIGLGMGMGMGGMGGLGMGMGYGGYGGMMSMMPGMSVSPRPDRIIPLSSSRSRGMRLGKGVDCEALVYSEVQWALRFRVRDTR
jgi:hypothetical protein